MFSTLLSTLSSSLPSTLSLRTLFRGSAAASVVGLAIAAGLVFKQWLDAPIAVQPFTVEEGAPTAGISPATLADQTKAHISTIYSEAGVLFETRKLGEPTVPLNVQIGDTGWNLQTLAKALGIPLTSAEVWGHVFQDGNGLILQWTTLKAGRIAVDTYTISAAQGAAANGDSTAPADDSLSAKLDRALECLALKTVAGLTPDAAANYLHKQHEAAGGGSTDRADARRPCIAEDDAELYSQVGKDEALPPAARVNAFVGLSVHFSYSHSVSEELTMAQAATHLASRTLTCDDTAALPTRWRRLKCRLSAYRPFSDRNTRAEVAAWMQLGAAQSDYAATATTLREMLERRAQAIDAYRKVIEIKGDYALAYDALGLQHSLRNEVSAASAAYSRSLELAETPAAHIDLGFLSIHGRNDGVDDRVLQADELRAAEMHFRRTIELAPDYWDAHGALGYVLYKAGKFRDAADALEEAAQRDASNRGLRLLLGAAYAGLCRFDDARAGFKTAHDANVSDKDEIEALNTKTDWGQTLDEFGFHDWAMAEVSRVLAANPLHVDALKIRGEAKLAAAGQNLPQVGEALADLRAAVANDTAKSDAVLNAYLDALSRTTGADEAVSTYETWSQNGIVPALATSSIVDAVIIPDTRRTRRTYADALAKLNRLDSARRELDVLSRLGMVVEAPDADSQPHPANAPANVPESAPIFTHVSTRGEVAARECTRPNLAEPPLL